MQTTPDQAHRGSSRPDDFTRTGAVWVTGTGAFLVVVAATVFVAVRWDHLPDTIKLAILGALSGSALLAGRRLRRRLPATGAVLYHLGAFLLPVATAAVALRFDTGWGGLLLIEGTTGAAAFTVLERVERSVVLRVAAGAAVVVAALGLGATVGIAPAATLAAAAVLAELSRRRTLAAGWALLAGIAPAIALTAGDWPSPTILDDLALTDPNARRVALVGSIAAGVVLWIEARARRDLVLLVASALSITLGIAATWQDLRPTATFGRLGLALGFVALEVAAWFVHEDDFLRAPSRLVAGAAEVVAGAVATTLAGVVLVAPHVVRGATATQIDGALLATALVATTGWIVADIRRRTKDQLQPPLALLLGSGWVPATLGTTATVIAGVALATGSAVATALTLAALAGVLVLSGREYGHALAAWFSVAAVATVTHEPAVAAICAVAGTVTLSSAAVLRARRLRPDSPELASAWPWALAYAALLPPLFAIPVIDGWAPDVAVLGGWVLTCWIAALILDTGATKGFTPGFGLIGRAGTLVVLPLAFLMGSAATAEITGAIALLSMVDARRRRQPLDGSIAVIAAPIAVLATGLALDGSGVAAPIAVGAFALLLSLGTLVASDTWRPTVDAAAIWSITLALFFGIGHDTAFATVLLLAGASALTVAVGRRSAPYAVSGATLVCLGVWIHLDLAGVNATDAYVAPVAVALVAAGFLARRPSPRGSRELSSWVAYGPAIALLGAAAMAERLAGGAGVHALVAGSLGTVAVAIGGWRRLAAPLLLGTALMAAVVLSETLAYTATMPTWGWLALAGSALLAAGIAMERAEVGPLETGRRVLDVVHDRFA
jgi:hypothetical protein